MYVVLFRIQNSRPLRVKEYFEELLNHEEEREAIVLAIRERRGMSLLGELNDRPIGMDEIEEE